MAYFDDEQTMADRGAVAPVIDGGGYGDDWQAAAAEQERRRRDEEMTARMNENRADLAQYDEILGAQRAQAAQRRANGLRQTAIAMRYAMQNGGKVPEQLIPAFNQKMGYDGKTRRFLGGMYDGKGNLHFFMQNGDGQGNFQDAPVTLDRKGQFDLMREFPGIFSDEDVNAMAQSLMTKDGLTRDQIWGAGAAPGSKTATGGTVVNPSWLGGPQRRSSISAFGANGRGGFTNYESNADTGYQLQQRDSGTRAPQPELSERERIARMKEQGALDRAQMREAGIAERMANRDQTRRDIAEAANLLKKYGIDVSAELKDKGLEIQQQNADERSAHNLATETVQQQRAEETSKHNRATEATAEKNADTARRRAVDQNLNAQMKIKQDDEYRRAVLKERQRQFDEKQNALLGKVNMAGIPGKEREALMKEIRLLGSELRANIGEMDADTKSGARARYNELLKRFKVPEATAPQSDADGAKAQPRPVGDNGAREIRKDRNGVEWEIVRDENGKPIGKRRVTR